MSHRYIVTAPPFVSAIGKFCRSVDKCSNRYGTDISPIVFWYGYRKNNSAKHCIGFREKCRNLTIKPYTSAEIANKNLFTTSINAVSAHWYNPLTKAKVIAELRTQKHYVSAYNFAIAQTIFNNGIFPERWL